MESKHHTVGLQTANQYGSVRRSIYDLRIFGHYRHPVGAKPVRVPGHPLRYRPGKLVYKPLAAEFALFAGFRRALLVFGSVIVVVGAMVMWESPEGFPSGVGRVESRPYGFPGFPYPGISMACFLRGRSLNQTQKSNFMLQQTEASSPKDDGFRSVVARLNAAGPTNIIRISTTPPRVQSECVRTRIDRVAFHFFSDFAKDFRLRIEPRENASS